MTVVLFKFILQPSPGDIVTFHEHIVNGIENIQLLEHGEKIAQIVKTGIADVFAQVEVSPEDLRLQAVAELTQDENTPLRGVFADEADLIDRIAGGRLASAGRAHRHTRCRGR